MAIRESVCRWRRMGGVQVKVAGLGDCTVNVPRRRHRAVGNAIGNLGRSRPFTIQRPSQSVWKGCSFSLGW